MHLMFLGAPGSGKGTQAKILEKELGALQVSTGDILRKAVKDGTELGLKAKSYMDAGKYVPDELMIDLIRDKFNHPDFPEKWIMDGFPRTVAQAEAFDRLLSELGQKLDSVIEVKSDKEALIVRITGRRVCRNCQAPYHVNFNPPKQEGICDYCGHDDIYQRSDDQEDVVRKRLDVYEEQTLPLVNYYQTKGILQNIDGNQSVENVTRDIFALLNVS